MNYAILLSQANDWATIGSMLGGIGTWAAAIISAILSWKIISQTRKINDLQMQQQKKINEAERKQKERDKSIELKISEQETLLKQYELKVRLFEERYAIYIDFKSIYDLVYKVLEDLDFKEAFNYNMSEGITYALYEVGITEQNISVAKRKISLMYGNSVAKAKFCFDKAIAAYMMDFLKTVVDVAYPEGFLYGINEQKDLIELVRKNEQEKILDKIEKVLDIAYVDIQ
jgi:hypothetical protein